ncbi:hypothetical protein SEUCBS139899_000478 [Sporothrix eucalyptigena]|uniref:LysM domain-containing protein n=1 Tax=Sporothrix eucalyptigena TaxID=1812306 RepID=A0ABP0BBW4_9PEZI
MVPSRIVLLFAAAVAASAVLTGPDPAATPAAAPHCYLHVKARAGDSCAGIAAVFNIDAAAFRRMNPGVAAADCSHLTVGTTYCVADGSEGSLEPSPPKTPPSPSPPKSPPLSPPTPPTPRQSPITDACRSWHLVSKGETCTRIEKAVGISHTQFRKWNGFIDDDCSNLWLGYYCCIGV